MCRPVSGQAPARSAGSVFHIKRYGIRGQGQFGLQAATSSSIRARRRRCFDEAPASLVSAALELSRHPAQEWQAEQSRRRPLSCKNCSAECNREDRVPSPYDAGSIRRLWSAVNKALRFIGRQRSRLSPTTGSDRERRSMPVRSAELEAGADGVAAVDDAGYRKATILRWPFRWSYQPRTKTGNAAVTNANSWTPRIVSDCRGARPSQRHAKKTIKGNCATISNSQR